jgi:cysteine-rich repeat protein
MMVGCGGSGDDAGPNQNNNSLVLGVCGDGVLNLSEECDQGGDNSDIAPDTCRTNCRLPHCGDTVVDTGEVCDDGNFEMGDGCSECSAEEGWICSVDGCSEVCGDGVAVGAESCDGTDLRGETCVSLHYPTGTLACLGCDWNFSGCNGITVGNGILDPGEECDTNNKAFNDPDRIEVFSLKDEENSIPYSCEDAGLDLTNAPENSTIVGFIWCNGTTIAYNCSICGDGYCVWYGCDKPVETYENCPEDCNYPEFRCQ